MLPVTSGIASLMGIDPTILYFGLLSVATLGGNITPIGASANITGLGILKREGHEVSAKDFMKISVPSWRHCNDNIRIPGFIKQF
jgi:Na+/H+ antiporter NhaD/arsenite permease-like protein